MTLLNQQWITLDGTPVTGRVPPRTTLYAPPGVEATPQQLGAVVHAYKLFCDAVNGSAFPSGFHTQHRVFTDGTRAHFEANGGVHTAKVWISGDATSHKYRGFIIAPKFPEWEVAGLEQPRTNALLRSRSTAPPSWRRRVSPYRPGKEATPTYWVDATERTKMSDVEKDTNYADVYTLSRQRLFLNGQPHMSLPLEDDTVPVLRRAEENKPVWFGVSDDKVTRVVDGAPSSLWDMSLLPILPTGFSPNTHVRYLSATGQADYIRIALNDTGTMQRRSVRVTLLPEDPWVTYTEPSFAQLNAAGTMAYHGGWVDTSRYSPSEPFGPVSGDAVIVGSKDGSPVTAKTLVPRFLRTMYVAAQNLSESATIELYPGKVARVERTSEVNSTTDTGSGDWYGTWPGPTVFTSNGTPKLSDYTAYLNPRETFPGASDIREDDEVAIACRESGTELVHSDSSSSSTYFGETKLFSTSTTHNINHRICHYRSIAKIEFAGSEGPIGPFEAWFWAWEDIYYIGSTQYGGWVWHYSLVDWVKVQLAKKEFGPPRSLVQRTETMGVTAESRDYLLFDEENETYVYLKGTLTGHANYSYNEADGSESSSAVTEVQIKIEFVLESPITTVTKTIKEWTLDIEPNINLLPPLESFQNTDCTWHTAAPLVNRPVFIPMWFNQSLCPFIAYTTTDEVASATAENCEHRLLASFRMQMQFVSRPMFAPITELPNVTQVILPMFEGMVQYHVGPYFYWQVADLESTPLDLNASFPGTNVHADLGMPATTHSEVYRT